MLLVSSGADAFAEREGLEIVEPSYFQTETRKMQLEILLKKRNKKQMLDHSAENESKTIASEIEFNVDSDKKFGTVGAVARDMKGNFAAATSTGGTMMKLAGRVGDSPIVGAGTFANTRVAVSCTGLGEAFICNCLRIKFIEFN